MRELKFRFWNTIARRFQPSKRYAIDGNGNLLGYDFDLAQYDDDPVPFAQTCIIPQQYTGLKDKNGKEIFEGDLIKLTEIDEDSCFGREDTEVVEVKWLEDIAQFRAIFKSGRRTELHFVVQLPTVVSCEIIGNIYENPELLNN